MFRGQGDVVSPEHHLAHRMSDAFGEILGVLSDHLADDPVRVDVGHALVAGDATVAQHR